MTKQYLIFYKGSHPAIHFVRADDPTQAMTRFILAENDEVKIDADGRLIDEEILYSHPLAYIEAAYRIYGEWQIRELADWTREAEIAEVFCGKSSDGPAAIIALCRRKLLNRLPRSGARAFVWYLRQGTLVTFYRKRKPLQIEVIARCLWNWDGKQETLTEWHGDYSEITANLDTDIIRPIKPVTN